jgi:thiol-disulfide isomerase/thioredoxin
MEPLFGADFSQVRIHTDAKAIQSAGAVDALAYTVGNDVVFGAGQYALGTTMGERLLAHELTHVTQQQGAEESGRFAVGRTDALEEQQARSGEDIVQLPTKHIGLSPVDGSRTLRRQQQPRGQSSATSPGGPAAASSCVQETTVRPVRLAPRTVTIVDYWAPWCQPCMKMKPVVEAVCKELKAAKPEVAVRFFSIKHDADKDTDVSGLPTLRVYAGVTAAPDSELGQATAAEIKAAIEKAKTAAKAPSKAPTQPPPTKTPAPTIPAGAPTPSPARPEPATCKDPPDPPCQFIPLITGPSVILRARANPTAADPRDRTQTVGCGSQLFTIDTVSPTTPNTKIIHVAWVKEPPTGTWSVTRTANDDTGDAPFATGVGGKVGEKKPSWAALNPSVKNPIPAVKTSGPDQIGCPVSGDKPVWCVPFCSFGEFTMEAFVTWECDPDCLRQTHIARTPPFKINVKEPSPSTLPPGGRFPSPVP